MRKAQDNLGKRTLFKGIANLVTLAGIARKEGRRPHVEDLSILKDGALLVENGRILQVGFEHEAQGWLKAFGDVEVVDLKGKTVLPAFLECHTHSIFSGDRFAEFEMRMNGATYQEIAQKGGGIRSTVKSTREASDKDLIDLLASRVKEFRRQGVSFVEVKTGYGLSAEQELRLLRLIHGLNDQKVVGTFLGPHSSSPEFENLDDYMKSLIHEVLPEMAKGKLCCRVDIFMESGFFKPKHGDEYFKAAKDLGFDIAAHVEQLSWSGGLKKALEYGAKSVDHCVNASDEDLRLLASSQTTSVLLPSSDFYLDINYPPARKMIESGVRVALSTDFNPGSSPSQSVELCSLLARIKMKMTLPEIFSAWTIGAAYALGLEKDCGSLESGKLADFSVWNKDWTAFFYNFEEIHPRDLYLSGKRVAF